MCCHHVALSVLIHHAIQISCAAENAEGKITVVADDNRCQCICTVAALSSQMANLKNVVLLESPIKGRTLVNIGKNVQKHSEIVEEILPAHVLSGCDTVASYFGIGNAVYSKHFDRGTHLTCWVHQGILLNMLFNMPPPSFPRAMGKQTVVQCQRQGSRYGCQKQAKRHQHRSCVPCHQQLRHSRKMLKELTIMLWYGNHWKRRLHPSWTQLNMIR